MAGRSFTRKQRHPLAGPPTPYSIEPEMFGEIYDALEEDDTRLDTVESGLAGAGPRLAAAESSITDHGTRLGGVESGLATAGPRLTAAEASIAGHAADKADPHNVTKAQVGLGTVPDVDATQRSNHTGTQAISTIDGLQQALTGKADQTALATATAATDDLAQQLQALIDDLRSREVIE